MHEEVLGVGAVAPCEVPVRDVDGRIIGRAKVRQVGGVLHAECSIDDPAVLERLRGGNYASTLDIGPDGPRQYRLHPKKGAEDAGGEAEEAAKGFVDS